MDISNQPRNHNYSRPLDVHLTCNHSEINELVEVIFDKYFDTTTPKSIKPYKKHLKIVLLDLYVAWLHDPLLETAVHLSPNHYSKERGSRESKLYITKTIIPVIHTLRDKGLIGFQTGFHNHPEYGNRLSRIWASPILEDYFKEIQSLAFYDFYKEREVIVLRDEDKKDIAYKRNSHVDDMKTVVDNYNSFLRETFIDIPYLDKPTLKYKDSKGYERNIHLNQQSKFTRRIFNKSSFELGGRFYGGWWQSISEEYRKGIYIDNSPTREIDFTAFHPILAYAEKGINYWETSPVGSNSITDPYDIPTIGIEDKKIARKFNKLLFLTCLNADTETEAFGSFNDQWRKKGYTLPDNYNDLFKHHSLKEQLEKIKEYHYPIRDMFCTGVGIKLMNIDSQITEHIIRDHIERRIPILTIHDSYIVPYGLENGLLIAMKKATEWITGFSSEVDYYVPDTSMYQQYMQRLAHSTEHRDYGLDGLKDFYKRNQDPPPTKGYLERWAKHKSFYSDYYPAEKYSDQ